MKIEVLGDTLRLSAIAELGAANWTAFRDQARAAFSPGVKNVEVDLSQTQFLDSCGLGALIALQKTARARAGSVRLLDPPPAVVQILELTRTNQIFEILNT